MPPKKGDLAKYLHKLCTNKQALDKHNHNPRKAMEDEGLAPETIQLIESGDMQAIANAVQQDSPEATVLKMPIVSRIVS